MIKKKEKRILEIQNRILSLTDGKDYGILPPPLDPQVALNELAHYFLGDDIEFVNPISNLQANTEIVIKIEMRYKGARKRNERL